MQKSSKKAKEVGEFDTINKTIYMTPKTLDRYQAMYYMLKAKKIIKTHDDMMQYLLNAADD